MAASVDGEKRPRMSLTKLQLSRLRTGKNVTWCVDFFDKWDDASPSRSMIISANSEDEAVDKAAAQMGDAVRIEFTRTFSE